MTQRCQWCNQSKLYQDYHDNEWGVPSYDDDYLFEMLVLETMQAGLSWYTVLQKRENYRKKVFSHSIQEIANFDDDKLEELTNNQGLIRHKLKIKSIVKNAIAFLQVQNEFGSFSNYIWSFTNNLVIKNNRSDNSEIPITTALSDEISRNMKKRCFGFVGSITIYAYLQAIGVVSDHDEGCWKYHV